MAEFLLNDLFPTLLDFGDTVWGILSYTLADFVSLFDIEVPSWGFLNYSLLGIILGGGLLFYLGFQLIKWVIDILP